MIRLRALTPDETRDVLVRGGLESFRGIPAAGPDVLPDVVAEDALGRHEGGEDWFWCAPRVFDEPGSGLLAGSAGFRSAPRDGAVEIGYGVSASCAGRGLATEAAALMVREAFARSEVAAVTAETAEGNRGSERVLEKNGFRRCGRRVDPDDGPVTQWRLDRPSA